MKCRGEYATSESESKMADCGEDTMERSDSPAVIYPDYDDRGHGHFFVKKTFHKPTYCHHCTDMLWGLIGQGLVCEVCNFVVHDKCLRAVVSACSSIAATVIKNPVAHCWSESGQFKRKFCNVCRKRLEDSLAVRCEICEYYAHLDCHDFVVSDCKECAMYSPTITRSSIIHYHHWREGNMPANSKCLACKKTCWSSECLAGMRCEWCGLTAHASCYRLLPAECNFGSLREIMLPSSCLSMPRMDLSVETMMGMSKKTNIPTRTISEDWSSSGDSRNEEEEKERRCPRDREGKDKDKDTEWEIIRVFDGNASMKRRLYRTISVPKHAPAQAILEAALKTFHISDDPKNYYVAEASEFGENQLDENKPIRTQLKTPDGKRPSIFLRYKERDPDRGHIKVYPGGLKVCSGHKNITVTSESTTEDIIRTALKKFGIEETDPTRFSLIEVLLDKGVSERKLEHTDKPWELIKNNRKESLRQNQMTRYYLQQKEDPHGPNISLFVGNLPTGLSQRQYEKILLDIVGKANKWVRFDVIYYEYGALVLDFSQADKATRVFNILKDAVFDEKQLLVLLLPNIQPHMIPDTDNANPLLVFVNIKSGGCQGLNLITSFRKLLNPHQVFNLENGGPLPGLYVFRNVPYYKILACGGDGTVGWVLSCLDNVGQDAICQSPPLSILPLGTGNDLARVLRWGPGYTDTDPLNYLRDVIDAEDIKLDRWTVIFHPNEKEQDETKVAIANDTNTANTNEDTTTIFVMNNYFGIGIDADISLDFHQAREEKPDKFNSRIYNKKVYVQMSLRKMVARTGKDLRRYIRLEVDGKLVDLPPCEGIIILNILSWGSGANPWGPEKEDQFQKPTHYDGNLEVVGITGVVHMAQIHSGLRTGIRVAQGGHLRITLLTDIPVQVDGEPWTQPAGQVVVLRSALKATMLKKTKNKIRRRNTEPSIFFPENDGLKAQSPNDETSTGPL